MPAFSTHCLSILLVVGRDGSSANTSVSSLYPEETCNGLRKIKKSFPNLMPHKMQYINGYICTCLALFFILAFIRLPEYHTLQFHAFFIVFFCLFHADFLPG